MNYLKVFFRILFQFYLLGATLYFLLSLVDDHIFTVLFRVYMYHSVYPYQYIGIFAVCFGVLITHWYKFCIKLEGTKRTLSIVVTLILTVFVASITGGMLWTVHDMCVGYFPDGRGLWGSILVGAIDGLFIGWMVILVSIPFNIFSFATGYKLVSSLKVEDEI